MAYPPDFNDSAFERTWGTDEPDDLRNEDEVIAAQEEGKKHLEKMMKNAHPDSILGCMEKLKLSLDAFNDKKNDR